MIREDRELLTEMARLNRDMAPLALRMMEGSASAAEQQHYARRLTDAGERLRRRAEETSPGRQHPGCNPVGAGPAAGRRGAADG